MVQELFNIEQILSQNISEKKHLHKSLGALWALKGTQRVIYIGVEG